MLESILANNFQTLSSAFLTISCHCPIVSKSRNRCRLGPPGGASYGAWTTLCLRRRLTSILVRRATAAKMTMTDQRRERGRRRMLVGRLALAEGLGAKREQIQHQCREDAPDKRPRGFKEHLPQLVEARKVSHRCMTVDSSSRSRIIAISSR